MTRESLNSINWELIRQLYNVCLVTSSSSFTKPEASTYKLTALIDSEQMLLSIETHVESVKRFDHKGLRQLQCTKCVRDIQTEVDSNQ